MKVKLLFTVNDIFQQPKLFVMNLSSRDLNPAVAGAAAMTPIEAVGAIRQPPFDFYGRAIAAAAAAAAVAAAAGNGYVPPNPASAVGPFDYFRRALPVVVGNSHRHPIFQPHQPQAQPQQPQPMDFFDVRRADLAAAAATTMAAAAAMAGSSSGSSDDDSTERQPMTNETANGRRNTTTTAAAARKNGAAVRDVDDDDGDDDDDVNAAVTGDDLDDDDDDEVNIKVISC